MVTRPMVGAKQFGHDDGMRGLFPQLLMSLLALLSPLTARASGLHPLKTALPEAELHLTLRTAARANEEVVVECDYKPRRERDVRKERALHLFDFLPWRIGSRDVLSVHREEAIRVTRTARAVDTTVIVTVPLHHPDPPPRPRLPRLSTCVRARRQRRV
jgi:hypothetical protein